MPPRILLGDEAVALGAVHAGITAAYAYPGTPSTEIVEWLLEHAAREGGPHAQWCANEKTALETALGTCFAGRRALVAMKHVGLNVAADPFVNAALVAIHGGLVVAVADDPGMHSSQNEQDSRFYAEFARTLCLEPASQQEAYDMTREAYDLSERFRVPVLLRLVTHLSHSRATVQVAGSARAASPPRKPDRRGAWVLLPANARQRWRELLDRRLEMATWSEDCNWNHLELNETERGLGVITTGIARNYYRESLSELASEPSHLHIGAYPAPAGLVRRLAAHARRILVLEDGQPFVERQLKDLLAGSFEVMGRLSGAIPATGELTPDIVRAGLGLPARKPIEIAGPKPPLRAPQLCEGCPHGHAYDALMRALDDIEGATVTSDIGCYTLGAMPPYSAIESCVCMGASIAMAKGAVEAGLKPVVAVIGDSTFLHSGVTPLLDAVASDTDMTVLILDNEAVGMTGAQDPIVPSARLEQIVLGAGVDPAHLHVVDPHPRKVAANADVIRREIDHPGLSVVIARRECKVAAKRRARARAAESQEVMA